MGNRTIKIPGFKNISSRDIEMAKIKAWLSANDYKINKHALGEYADDDPRWVEYLAERAVKLARYNVLEALGK